MRHVHSVDIVRPKIDRPLRVVAYTDAAGIGGAEISLSHLVTNVSGVDITVLGTSGIVVDAIAAQQSTVSRVVLPAVGFGTHLQALLRLRPDVVHFNLCTPWAGAMGLIAALMLPTARVVRVDQLPLRTTDGLKLWRTRALSLRVDAHVSVGEASARQMEDFYALGRGTVLSIPNCVPDGDPPGLLSTRTSRQLVVGSVGRLDKMKAHDILIRAIAQLDGVRLVVLGEGEQRSALTSLAADLGISDRIDLLGWADNPRVHLPSFDIIALPSRSEGFPLAVVEAMFAARPVVATRVGSVAEAVSDGETGLLVDKDDVEGLAAALRLLRDDPVLCVRLGQRAREVAIARFTVEHMVDRYKRLWHEVVQAPQAPRLQVKHPRE